MCVRTEHKMKSTIGIIVLVVGSSKSHVDTVPVWIEIHDENDYPVVGNGKSCVKTKHEVKPKVKQESCSW